MGMLDKMGMKRVVDGAERLNRILQSIDNDLKSIGSAFNSNFVSLNEDIIRIEKKLDDLIQKVEQDGDTGCAEEA